MKHAEFPASERRGGQDPNSQAGYIQQQVQRFPSVQMKIDDVDMTAGRLSTDPATRREAYTRVQVRLDEDLPFWVYQEAAGAIAFNAEVTGLQPFDDGLLLVDRIGFRR